MHLATEWFRFQIVVHHAENLACPEGNVTFSCREKGNGKNKAVTDAPPVLEGQESISWNETLSLVGHVRCSKNGSRKAKLFHCEVQAAVSSTGSKRETVTLGKSAELDLSPFCATPGQPKHVELILEPRGKVHLTICATPHEDADDLGRRLSLPGASGKSSSLFGSVLRLFTNSPVSVTSIDGDNGSSHSSSVESQASTTTTPPCTPEARSPQPGFNLQRRTSSSVLPNIPEDVTDRGAPSGNVDLQLPASSQLPPPAFTSSSMVCVPATGPTLPSPVPSSPVEHASSMSIQTPTSYEITPRQLAVASLSDRGSPTKCHDTVGRVKSSHDATERLAVTDSVAVIAVQGMVSWLADKDGDCVRWRERALKAENEVARLQDMLADRTRMQSSWQKAAQTQQQHNHDLARRAATASGALEEMRQKLADAALHLAQKEDAILDLQLQLAELAGPVEW